jgi:hypothetical protein
MNDSMKSQQFQYQNYNAAEFEQFRNAVQADGFTVTQNTIDTVSGHIGSLTYLTGFYNRNQQTLTVTVKTSPWQSLQDVDLKSNVNRVVARDTEAETKVNAVPLQTPPAATITPLGTNKNIVQPPVPLKVAEPAKTPEPVKTPEPAKVAPPVTSVPAQTPKPAQTPAPAQAAPATPTESK